LVPISSIVAIGDELVGGFTLDTNSHWMSERLRLLGYPLKRVTQIRDKPHEIIEQVGRELDDADITDVFRWRESPQSPPTYSATVVAWRPARSTKRTASASSSSRACRWR
jgi:hypothetical protein